MKELCGMTNTRKTAREVRRKTKIVATLGPNSSDEKTLAKMLKAGMNVARINFSHGDHQSNGALIEAVRRASELTGKPVAILQDLCGPKIRIGDFETELVKLRSRTRITLTTKKVVGTPERVSVNYKRLPKEVEKGTLILLNDGKVLLRVRSTTDTDIECDILRGGMIRGRRGVNAPGTSLSISALTTKDKNDLKFGLSIGVHFVTLSFVRKAKEIRELRKLLGEHRHRVGIIAKIETEEAIANIDEIIEVSDGIMVARGDLAIEIPRERVPLVQKEVIRKCNALGKPVITATQMLDSMRDNEVPTRAEVNDVANAVLDGTDAVMLSDETAVGNHPVEAIEAMDAIAKTVEASVPAEYHHERHTRKATEVSESITAAIAEEARRLNVSAIVTLSESGTTARLVARHRPRQPILVLTLHEYTFYQLQLLRDCYPVYAASVSSLAEALDEARQHLIDGRFARTGDRFILGAGMRFKESGATNLMVIERV